MLNNIMENTYVLHVNTTNTMFSFSIIVFNMMKLLVVLLIMKLIAQINAFKCHNISISVFFGPVGLNMEISSKARKGINFKFVFTKV